MTKPGELLVSYPGHLGPEPVTRLRSGNSCRWTKGQVRSLPRADALDLVRLGGFRLVPAAPDPAPAPAAEPAAIAAAEPKPARGRRGTPTPTEPAAGEPAAAKE